MDLLNTISIVSLTLAGLCAVAIGADILTGHPQKMSIMNWVWPITAIWSGPLGLWAYLTFGRMKPAQNRTTETAPPSRKDSGANLQKGTQSGSKSKSKQEIEQKSGKPFWQIVTVGDLHCAAGCTLGDFAGEWLVFLTAFTLAGSVLWSDYLLDFALAYTVGIVFQYFAIAPMRNLSGWPGILAAMKADTISLVAFEVGMFAWMALTHEVFFKPPLKPTTPTYWFMMQIAMAVGFLTAYPANRWLMRKGLKEAM